MGVPTAGHDCSPWCPFCRYLDDVDSYAWAKIYAYNPDPDPLIYAALLGVPSALFAAALKFYNEGRQGVGKCFRML